MARLTTLLVTIAAFLPAVASADRQDADTGVDDSTAAADARVAYAGPPGTAPELEPPPPAPPATGLDAYRDADASSNRAFATGTALTNRAGAVNVELWAPAVPVGGVLSVGYGITDRLQVSVATALVFDEEGVALGSVTAKYQIARGERGALAISASHLRVADEDDSATAVSAIGSHCIDAECLILATAHLTGVTDGDQLSMIGGGSIVAGGRFKLVLDVATLSENDQLGALFYGGVRVASSSLAVDFGMAGFADDDESELIPVPLLGASARW